MEKIYKVPPSKTPSETYEDMIADVSECYICRDVALASKGKLRRFCDCKSLLAHHACLATWIHKGFGSEDRLRCRVCNAEYRLRRHHPCRVLICWWQTWLLLLLACVLLGLVPYVVYCMTTLNNPPPHTTFKVAAVLFGVLAETLLIKCVSSYLSSRYRLAKMSAVSALV